MSAYKDTLNLPKTSFPMKANLAQREPKVLAKWESDALYQQMLEAGQQRAKTFILHDGPPYANGDIHLGHVVNKVLKDIIIKSKWLDGYNAPYVPGWDCHGLPIELMVEKKIGKPGVKVDRTEFRAACRDYAHKQVQKQKEDFKRLGVLGDWDNPYLTMDYQTEASIIRALGKIVEAGCVYQGEKPVHWCLDCGSALAEAEVEYQDKKSPSIDVRFKVVDTAGFLVPFGDVADIQQSLPVSVIIWTTTPWTLPANQAVSLNPGIDYVLLRCGAGDNAELLVVAEALAETVMARAEISDYSVIGLTTGDALENQRLQHPLYNRTVPIILGDHVVLDAGTGAVHTAPAHGHDDYTVGLKYGLTVDCLVNANGIFGPDTELFAGEHIFKANAHVIDVLQEKGTLLHHTSIQHSYPHCWRHKTPIITRTTPQWFIGMEQAGLRDKALDEIKKTKWVPSWGENRINSMIDNRPDWCISRQRTWGVPIALFIHKDTRALHPDTPALIEKVAGLVEEKGIDAWFEVSAEELIGADASEYEKIGDTLDVWFDSGVTHFSVLDQRADLQLPADIYLEGSDQHRGWFQSSLLTSVAIRGSAPYKAVLTHGFVVDANGRKMSKSEGNVIAPKKVINQYGADVLRLWAAATDYSGEMTASDEILKRISDTYRRIRNTIRFLLGNLDGFTPERDSMALSDMIALDQWVVARTQDVDAEIRAAYAEYNFHVIYQKLLNFCVNDMGGFYLDVLKDRLYTVGANSAARRSAQTAMLHIVHAMVRWMAPILSFTADEIWPLIPGHDEHSAPVFLDSWYQFPESKGLSAPFDMTYWAEIIRIRSVLGKFLENQRVAGNIGSSLDAEIVVYASAENYELLHKLGDELRFVLITSAALVLPESEKTANTEQADDGLWVSVVASEHAKCDRCWHLREDVGSNSVHPLLCGRCIDNIDGAGETRLYA